MHTRRVTDEVVCSVCWDLILRHYDFKGLIVPTVRKIERQRMLMGSAMLEKTEKTRRKETVKGALQLVVAYMFSKKSSFEFFMSR